MTLPLPKRAAELIDQVKSGYHPGLALDKHLDPPADAEKQKPLLQRVCSGGADPKLLDSLNERRRQALPSAILWSGKSSGPLTLHLSRATALESAGIALHPIYGFAYLPGSGLKGLARAWAERVWLEAQPDRNAAVRQIRQVFGYAPNSERGKSWIPEEIVRDPGGSAGSVIFHDAWPRRWPQLVVDVVGLHHPKYYQETNDQKVPPPGDWEDPKPINFLAVDAGSEFEFALAPRRPEHADLAREAAEWLKAALADWGAGAKTAAGYGRIVSEGAPKPVRSPLRRQFECTVELVTPAFLAGAFGKEEDCDLRGATLRGQLRWWWRTMHAGHLEPRLLRRLETAIWGAASEGSAVQLALEPVSSGRSEQIGMAGRDNPLGYLAYGMQRSPDRPWDRPAKPARSQWRLAITARKAEFRRDPKSKNSDSTISADTVLGQAAAALWLLTRYGGVGAKGRKGFGSLADIAIEGVAALDDCERSAKALRDAVGLAPGNPDFRAPCLERIRISEPIQLRDSDPARALRAVATAYRDFVKTKSMQDRAPLGLPRKQNKIDMGRPVGPISRHPTTVHFHLARSGSELALRSAGFAIERLVRGNAFFQEMEATLRNHLSGPGPGSIGPGDGRRPGPPRGGPLPQATARTSAAGLLFSRGDRVRNADGEEGIVMDDVRLGEREMMVEIGGSAERERVGRWQKI